MSGINSIPERITMEGDENVYDRRVVESRPNIGSFPQPEWPQLQQQGGGGDSVPVSFRLQLLDATGTGGVKVRVRYGEVGGFKADSSMDVTETTPFVLSVSTGTFYVQCDVSVHYDDTVGIWRATGCEIALVSSAVPNDGTSIYVYLGVVISDGTTLTILTPQPVKGDVTVQRMGNLTNYVDTASS